MRSSACGVTTGDAAPDEPSASKAPAPDRESHHESGPDRDDAGERVDPDPAGHAQHPTSEADDAAPGAGDPVAEIASDWDAGFGASDAMGGERGSPGDDTWATDGADNGGSETDPEGATPDGGRLATDRTTVRITRDIGEVLGVDDSAYDLADGDVVTLPSTNAEPLLDRDAARRIE
jgi:DNA replication factor GINS